MTDYSKVAALIPWKSMGRKTPAYELGKSLVPVGGIPFDMPTVAEVGGLVGVPGDSPDFEKVVMPIIGTAFQAGVGKLVTCAHVAEPLMKERNPAMIARIIRNDKIIYVPYRVSKALRFLDPRSMKVNLDVDISVLIVNARRDDPMVPYEVPVVKWGDSSRLGVGDRVLLGGYPLGKELFFVNKTNRGIVQPTFYDGIVSAILPAQSSTETRIIQVSVPVCGGISGGVMFDPKDGKVYGMVTSGITVNSNVPLPMTYVIPSEVIKPFVDTIVIGA